MAKQIYDLPCPFCSAECPYYEPSIDYTRLYGDDKVQLLETVLTCRYERVCTMWNDERMPKVEETVFPNIETPVIPLEIGQSIFIVCELYDVSNKNKFFVSQQKIMNIETCNDRILYIAGRYCNLVFCEKNPGQYQLINSPYSRVHLSEIDAKSELQSRKK